MSYIEKITAAQAGFENTDAYMVGQQLKDICRDTACADLVAADLENPGMGLKDCAAKIKEWADEQHKKNKGSCICVPPDVAEGIIRKFYGLPDATSVTETKEPEVEASLESLFEELW